eukprot:COSAG01_NODE_62703_length_283_cov_0.945652_1_plen_46_part_10
MARRLRSHAQAVNYVQYQSENVPVVCLVEGPAGVFKLAPAGNIQST